MTLVPPASTSRVMVSRVRPAWLARMRVACTTLLSMEVICSTSVRGVQPPYWCRVLVMLETVSAWPAGVTPSVRAVVALGRLSYLRNSMVLPPPTGTG